MPLAVSIDVCLGVCVCVRAFGRRKKPKGKKNGIYSLTFHISAHIHKHYTTSARWLFLLVISNTDVHVHIHILE